MEENNNQIQKKGLSIKNLGTYLFKEIKKKHRLKLKGSKQIAPRGISPVISRPGSRINELQERGAKIKRALEQFAPPLNSTEIFEQDKQASAPNPIANKENQQNTVDAKSLHKLVNERLGAAPPRLSVPSSGFQNDARTPPCTPLKSKNQSNPHFFENNNRTMEHHEITVENTVCTSKVPIMEDDMDEDFHETNNSNENDTNVKIQISGSHGDSDFEDEEEPHEDPHEDETEDDERLRQVLCTFFPQSTSVSLDNSSHPGIRRIKNFSRSDVSNALDFLCSSPDKRKHSVLNSSTGSLQSVGWNPPMQNSYLNATTPARRNFQQEDLSLSPLSIKSPVASTPSSIASSSSKDRKDWKKARTFSFSSFKK